MTEIPTPLRDELRELERQDQAAAQRAAVARQRQNGETFVQAEREVLAELRRDRDDADFKHRPTGTPDEEDARARAITERIVAAVLDRGLTFAPVAGERIRGVLIVDPSIDREAREADAEARTAKAAVANFKQVNGPAIEEERKRREKAELETAIHDADVEGIRGILRLTDEARQRRESAAAAMTTADLPGGNASADEDAQRAEARMRFKAEADKRWEAEERRRREADKAAGGNLMPPPSAAASIEEEQRAEAAARLTQNASAT